MKRILDIFASLTALVLLSPVLIITALVVRSGLGPGVFFRQKRPGKHGRPFHIIKFRTMRDAVDSDGQPLPDHERLTRLGRFLRSTSLDELPELFNVLRGDMSLVGPRPLLMEYIPLYSRRQARRMEVRPGITGWAQINGRNAVDWEERFELDVWYVENRSLVLDFKILFMTVASVFKRQGISQPGQATMKKFSGSTPESMEKKTENK